MIKEPKGIHDVIKCLFFSKNFRQDFRTTPYLIMPTVLGSKKQWRKLYHAFGTTALFKDRMAHTEIFPKLPEVSHINTVFTVEYNGT